MVEVIVIIIMTSRFGSRTYGRPGKVCPSSIQFDQVFVADKNANRPSAAKSTGVLHKWGKTSFTSTRSSGQLNGQKELPVSKKEDLAKRPRLELEDDPFSFDVEGPTEPSRVGVSAKVASSLSIVATSQKQPKSKVQPAALRPNKFFKSSNRASLNTFRSSVLPFGKGSSKSLGKNESSRLGVSNEKVSRSPDVQLEEVFVDQTTLSDIVDDCGQSVEDVSRLKKALTDESSPCDSVDLGLSGYLSDESQSVKPEEEESDFLVVNKSMEQRFAKTYSYSTTKTEPKQTILTRQKVDDTCTTSTTTTPSSSYEILNTQSLTSTSSEKCSPEVSSLSSKKSIPPPEEKINPVPSSEESVIETDPSSCPPSQIVSGSSVEELGDSGGRNSSPEREKDDAKMFDDEEGNVELEISFLSEVVSPEKPAGSPDSSLDMNSPDEEGFDSQVTLPPPESSSQNTNSESQSSTSSKRILPPKARRIFNSPKKYNKKALYKHRPWFAEDSSQDQQVDHPASQPATPFDEFEEEEAPVAPLVRVTTWPTRIGEAAVTSVRCPKKMKEWYKVVRNVKQAHQCHESGETQEFNDDIEYLLGGLQKTVPGGTRCLSVISLASKCMAPAFRMHLKAHGTVSKIFSALEDAPADLNLALCTATLMFILSQDRLNMDLETGSLELMLQLLESDFSSAVHCVTTSTSSKAGLSEKALRELDRNQSKVRELCEEMQRKGHARHLNLDNITVGELASETLLSLTSRRAGEWFKEALRELGGLDHIVETIGECTRHLGKDLRNATDSTMYKLCKIDRCLRVLENVTVMNPDNQLYLMDCKDSLLIVTSVKVLRLCTSALPTHAILDKCEKDSPGYVFLNCILSLLRVLLNLTHDNALCSAKIGEQEGLVDISLHCILNISKVIPVDKVFDLFVLMLGLLINLMEHCSINRRRFFNTQVVQKDKTQITAVKILVNLFIEREEMAKKEEMRTDRLLDGKGDRDSDNEDVESGPSATPIVQDDLEVTITKALQKAGKHMEDSIIGAYVALLLGCLIQDNEEYTKCVRDQLPENNFQNMVLVLQKFYNFVTLTSTVGNTGIKSIQRVIKILESS